MTMEAIRNFDAGEKYNQWKLGDKHSMFVRFVYHSRKELAGESDKIVLDLTEKVDAEIKKGEGEVDNESEVLPGETTVVETEKEKEELVLPIKTTPDASGTTWPIQMKELGTEVKEESKLTLSPATMIVSGVIFVFILAMIIGSAVCCCCRKKRQVKKTRSPSIIIQRASPANSENSPKDDIEVEDMESSMRKEPAEDMEATQNPINQYDSI